MMTAYRSNMYFFPATLPTMFFAAHEQVIREWEQYKLNNTKYYG